MSLPAIQPEITSPNQWEPTTATVVQNLAHEVRQPLSAIETIAYYLEMNLKQHGPAYQQVTRLRELVEQANWMLSDVVQHLHVGAPQLQSSDLNEFLSEAVSLLSPARREVVSLTLLDSLPPIDLDANQVRHMVQTLLQVASRLSRGMGRIALSTSLQEDFLVLEMSVQDRFESPGEAERLFQPYDGHPAFQGGLGLASARKIAEAHGGRCTATRDANALVNVQVALPLGSLE